MEWIWEDGPQYAFLSLLSTDILEKRDSKNHWYRL